MTDRAAEQEAREIAAIEEHASLTRNAYLLERILALKALVQRRDDELARLNVGMDAYALQAEKQHARIQELTEPIPLLLFCPRCAAQHMDAPQPEKGWTNPPHRSHECQGCGYVWRPADVPTIGVETITTSGERDQSATPALKAQHEAALKERDMFMDARERALTDLTLAQREIERLQHRGLHAHEHDPANGKFHGSCARCGEAWPCKWSPEGQAEAQVRALREDAKRMALTVKRLARTDTPESREAQRVLDYLLATPPAPAGGE